MPVLVVNKFEWDGNAIYIGRSTNPKYDIFGNPFSHEENTLAKYKVATREEAIEKYRDWALDRWRDDVSFRLGLTDLVQRHLRGEQIVLACFCKPKSCHGDVLKSLIEDFADFGIVTLPDTVPNLAFIEEEDAPF